MKYLSYFTALFFALALAVAFVKPDAATEPISSMSMKSLNEDGEPGKAYSYTTRDTITNTEADTLTIPANFASRFSYSHSIVNSTVNGTANVKGYIEESNLYSGTDSWIIVDSIPTTAVARRIRRTGPEVYGVRQRIRIVGTGTQNTIYTLNSVYKRQ